MNVIDKILCFLFAENRSQKVFFCQEFLKTYRILDFPAAPGSEFYIWWRHQENDGSGEIIFAYFKSIFDGAHKYKVSRL